MVTCVEISSRLRKAGAGGGRRQEGRGFAGSTGVAEYSHVQFILVPTSKDRVSSASGIRWWDAHIGILGTRYVQGNKDRCADENTCFARSQYSRQRRRQMASTTRIKGPCRIGRRRCTSICFVLGAEVSMQGPGRRTLLWRGRVVCSRRAWGGGRRGERPVQGREGSCRRVRWSGYIILGWGWGGKTL